MRLIASLLCLLLTSMPTAANMTITWWVEAPFAPFGWLPNSASVTDRWMPDKTKSFLQWLENLPTDASESSPYAPFANGDVKKSPWDAKYGLHRRSYVHPTEVTIRAKVLDENGHVLDEDEQCIWRVPGRLELSPVQCSNVVTIKDLPLTESKLEVVIESTGKVADSVNIQVDHRVIVALGDSYASGEGNPDIPTKWKSKSVSENDLTWIETSRMEEAQWFDNDCHRSFFSSQTFVAMKIAAQHPHRLVTYLHYACSGAEIFDGMLVTQKLPPGASNRCNGVFDQPEGLPDTGKRAECYVPKSQLAAMVSDLCLDKPKRIGYKSDKIGSRVEEIAYKRRAGLWRMETYEEVDTLDLFRCQGRLVSPDLVLLSIGGNDAGFSSLVGWAIAPALFRTRIVSSLVKGNIVCPDRARTAGCTPPYDNQLIYQLGRRYYLLRMAMQEVGIQSNRNTTILQTTYPSPLKNRDGSYCGDPGGHQPSGPWASAQRLIGSLAKRWEFNIRPEEAHILSKYTLPSLRSAISTGAMKSDFVLADLESSFIGHGWCDPDENDQPRSLPSHASKEDQPDWECEIFGKKRNPACWNGYKRTKRYIRTMNDSYLTQSSNRGDGHTGTMHPNVWGHGAMADEIYEKAKEKVSWITQIE